VHDALIYSSLAREIASFSPAQNALFFSKKKEETQRPRGVGHFVSSLIGGAFLRHFYSADGPISPEKDDFNLDFYRGTGVRCAFNYFAPYFL
jgi:hypothetical protein